MYLVFTDALCSSQGISSSSINLVVTIYIYRKNIPVSGENAIIESIC
jgi:hypothetical protein